MNKATIGVIKILVSLLATAIFVPSIGIEFTTYLKCFGLIIVCAIVLFLLLLLPLAFRCGSRFKHLDSSLLASSVVVIVSLWWYRRYGFSLDQIVTLQIFGGIVSYLLSVVWPVYKDEA